MSAEQEQALVQRNGDSKRASVPALRLLVVEVPNDKAAEHGKRYQSDSQVQRVESDTRRKAAAAPNDSAYADQWALPKIGWDSVYGSVPADGSASIAVLDTGVASGGDLSGRVGSGFSAIAGSPGPMFVIVTHGRHRARDDMESGRYDWAATTRDPWRGDGEGTMRCTRRSATPRGMT
jgi:hypothetical protein